MGTEGVREVFRLALQEGDESGIGLARLVRELIELAIERDGLECDADDGASEIERLIQKRVRRSPTFGKANPIAPPLRLQFAEAGGMQGEVSFGSAYEGPPGYVHGGVIASMFDTVLSAVALVQDSFCVTQELSVLYLRPTPLHRSVTFRAEREKSAMSGGFIVSNGSLEMGGTVLATGRAKLSLTNVAALSGSRRVLVDPGMELSGSNLSAETEAGR